MRENTISINPLWPSTLFLCEWGDHAKHAPGIVSHLNELAQKFAEPNASGVAGSAKPAKGLIESPMDLFRKTQHKGLLAAANWIANCVKAAVSKVNGDQVPPGRLQVEFTDSWFHITNDGGFHDAHTHGACSWCGIFYLVAGESGTVETDGNAVAGNGINRFYSPITQGGILRDFGNAYLGRCYFDVEPMDGRLVLFPSYLLHSALPYRGETDRVVIAFNTRTRLAPG